MKAKAAFLIFSMVGTILLVAVTFAMIAAVVTPHRPQVGVVQWSMPARFEANGAFTLGCALWDDPVFQEFSDRNPNAAMVYLGLSGDQENPMRVVAYIDRPDVGTVMLTGQSCGVSIDWSAFDTFRKLGPRPAP